MHEVQDMQDTLFLESIDKTQDREHNKHVLQKYSVNNAGWLNGSVEKGP